MSGKTNEAKNTCRIRRIWGACLDSVATRAKPTIVNSSETATNILQVSIAGVSTYS